MRHFIASIAYMLALVHRCHQECWETFTGQEMFKLLLLNTFAVVLFTFG